MHFRVLTYNIHKCIGGLDRRYNPARVAETIAHYNPDIVILQEAAVRDILGKRVSQADLLGNLLGYRHRNFVPHVSRRAGPYGNAILSRYPIIETRHIDLTIPLKKPRGALHARIRMRAASGHGRTLHIFNLHLGLSGIERKIQLRRFLASSPLAHLHGAAPVIIGGDFNDVWGTLGRKILGPAGFRGLENPLPTFPAFAPLRTLDSFYVRGAIRMSHVKRAQLSVARRASDHLPVVADIVSAKQS